MIGGGACAAGAEVEMEDTASGDLPSDAVDTPAPQNAESGAISEQIKAAAAQLGMDAGALTPEQQL